MSDLRERIRAAMNLPLGFSSVEARELLPLLLAEMDRLTAERDELLNVLRRIAEWSDRVTESVGSEAK